MNSIERLKQTQEYQRLYEPYQGYVQPWRKWGPYLSERSWATVREDYSSTGDAWNFLTHDLARSKAYRWGEDGIAGFCDRYQMLCFALALWNGKDPILKERLFGLTHQEGNHGEDVKEYYFYLDGLPTHSYMKYLYKYPQREFPYNQLIEENQRRMSDPKAHEFELIDTGIFDEDRYFDIFIEYAKAGPEDLCVRIQAFNRGPEPSTLHLIPQLWFRDTWSWGEQMLPQPEIKQATESHDLVCLIADDSGTKTLPNLIFPYYLGKRYLYGSEKAELLFTNNETHSERVFGPHMKSISPYVKDGFHRYIVNRENCLNPEKHGTKAGLHYISIIPAGESITLLFRLTNVPKQNPLDDIEKIIEQRKAGADEFYAAIHPKNASEEECMIQRQAFAGMLWNKQNYLFDVNKWLEGDNPKWPPDPDRVNIRNNHWQHLNSMRIFSMPDKWEYPWFAAWDLAFHSLTFALIDIEYAKEQVSLLLHEQFQHPNGQIPAYEWEFSDLNPPIFAGAALQVYMIEQEKWGRKDKTFLKKCFHKLLINFTWWVNRVDSSGKNIFEGGFLGLDNISIIDRSQKNLENFRIQQADATAWMAKFCLNMMHIAVELAQDDPAYEVLSTKFFEHYVIVAAAMKKIGGQDYEFWSEKDNYFYDVIGVQNSYHKIEIRSIVGLIPLFAIELIPQAALKKLPSFFDDITWFLSNRAYLTQACITPIREPNDKYSYLCTIVEPEQAFRIVQRVRDEQEFFSPYGIRSLSKYHEKHPFKFKGYTVGYEPGESENSVKGGNSNWRGPIWMPINYMLVQSLVKFDEAIGKSYSFSVSFYQTAEEIANRIISLFTRDKNGNRPIYGNQQKFQTDPHWRDYILFYEHFHGDTGRGLGASHQTGWTGLIANFIDEWRR